MHVQGSKSSTTHIANKIKLQLFEPRNLGQALWHRPHFYVEANLREVHKWNIQSRLSLSHQWKNENQTKNEFWQTNLFKKSPFVIYFLSNDRRSLINVFLTLRRRRRRRRRRGRHFEAVNRK